MTGCLGSVFGEDRSKAGAALIGFVPEPRKSRNKIEIEIQCI
jgi:hypothetical protein